MMTENRFASEGEWEDFNGSLLAVFERAVPLATTHSSALGHRSRTHIAFDRESLRTLFARNKFSVDDAKYVFDTLDKYPSRNYP